MTELIEYLINNIHFLVERLDNVRLEKIKKEMKHPLLLMKWKSRYLQ